MYKLNVIHRDIKPGNVMFHNGIAKLGDFGFCQMLKPDHKTLGGYGSPIYMAPEILKKKYYDHRVDIYSLGNTLYEILFGKCYESKDMAELVQKVEKGIIDFSNQPRRNHVSYEMEVLIRRMLKNDPKERITWEEIFNFDYTFASKKIEPIEKWQYGRAWVHEKIPIQPGERILTVPLAIPIQ